MAIEENDRQNTIGIVSWLTMTIMVVMMCLRMVAKLVGKRQAGFDDLLAILAMASGIGGTIALSSAANAGLGQSAATQSQDSLDAIERASYASSLLFFTTIWLAKLSTLVLLARLCANWKFPRLIWGSLVFVLAWGTVAIFVNAFQCSAPKPWDISDGNCIEFLSFLNSIGALDIASDIYLVALPFWLFGDLQMKLSSRAVVIAAFSCRVLVIMVAICRLVYLNLVNDVTNIFLNGTEFYICSQVQQCLSVVVASVPTVRILLERTAVGGTTKLPTESPVPHSNGVIVVENQNTHSLPPQLPRYYWAMQSTTFGLGISFERSKSRTQRFYSLTKSLDDDESSTTIRNWQRQQEHQQEQQWELREV